MNEPLLTLKDGVILEMSDWAFEDGFCETCSSYSTRLDVTYRKDGTDKSVYAWNLETDGARAFTFVMRNLSRIPHMTLEEFFLEIQK